MASILKQALDEFVEPEGNLHMIFDLYKDTNGLKVMKKVIWSGS